jgi:DNA-binding MarR family transcriptional regulator
MFMDNQDLHTLRLLEEMGNADLPPSQRDLAKKLGVSLGLVNSFVKRLVQKGYFKVSTIPRKRMRYVLTPKGATEKTRLTYKYMQHSYQFYKDARRKFGRLFQQLAEDGTRKIVFYGAGDVAEIAGICLEETGFRLVAVLDDDRVGERLSGVTVQNTDRLGSIAFDKVLVTTARPHRQVLKDIQKMGIGQDQVIVLA